MEKKIIAASQSEINKWESDNKERIVKWEKDFETMTIVFILDDLKTGEAITFKII